MSAVPLPAADKWECVLQRPFSGLFALVVVVVASVLKIHEIDKSKKKKKKKKKVKSENMQYSIAMKPFHNIILHKLLQYTIE